MAICLLRAEQNVLGSVLPGWPAAGKLPSSSTINLELESAWGRGVCPVR